jgi:hypothetical protein
LAGRLQEDRHNEIVEGSNLINLMKTILFAPFIRTALIVTLLLASAFNQGLFAADQSVKGKRSTKPVGSSPSHYEVRFNSIDGQPIRFGSGQ